MSLKSILLIEDDRINALTFKKGLSRVNDNINLVMQETGETALAYLRSEKNKLPSLIVLDLNLPKMSGIQFLKIIKTDPFLKPIPVIILTTSVNPKYKIDCFDLQVAGFFLKPLDYFELIESMFNYWTKSQFAELVEAK